jgi:hypothetical protein
LNNSASILADHDTSPDPQGSWVTLLAIPGPIGPNSEGGPSSAPADGEATYNKTSPVNHLHSNPYPFTGAPGQDRVCMAGNEKYAVGETTIGNPAAQAQGTIRVARVPFPDYTTR